MKGIMMTTTTQKDRCEACPQSRQIQHVGTPGATNEFKVLCNPTKSPNGYLWVFLKELVSCKGDKP